MENTIMAGITVGVEDELDLEKLAAFLKKELPPVSGELRVRRFPCCFSSLTYLLSMGQFELVLRRPLPGSDHNPKNEYHVLSHLIRAFQKIPRPFLFCGDERVIGAPFYVMERLRGVVLRRGGMLPSEDQMPGISHLLADTLSELHKVDLHQAALEEFGDPEHYVSQRLRENHETYRHLTGKQLPGMEKVISWLFDHVPDEPAAALIHNDFKLENLVFASDFSKVVGILDWEQSTLGHPYMDLGIMLANWPQTDDPVFPATHGLGLLSGSPGRKALLARYEQGIGKKVAHPTFYFVAGLLESAVMALVGYRRMCKADWLEASNAYLELANRTIQNGSME